MICPKCGGEVQKDDFICPHCGIALNGEQLHQSETTYLKKEVYCKNCGAKISSNAYVCPKCGVLTDNKKTEQDAPSAGFAILGFFFPVIGFILWLIWKDNTPLKASSCGKGALLGVIISVVLSVMTFGCTSCMLSDIL